MVSTRIFNKKSFAWQKLLYLSHSIGFFFYFFDCVWGYAISFFILCRRWSFFCYADAVVVIFAKFYLLLCCLHPSWLPDSRCSGVVKPIFYRWVNLNNSIELQLPLGQHGFTYNQSHRGWSTHIILEIAGTCRAI